MLFRISVNSQGLTQIDLDGGNTITLIGVSPAALTLSNFVFI